MEKTLCEYNELTQSVVQGSFTWTRLCTPTPPDGRNAHLAPQAQIREGLTATCGPAVSQGHRTEP